MAQKDLHNSIKNTFTLSQQKIGTDTTTNGVGVDTTFFESIEFVMSGGVNQVSIFKALLLLEDSDTDSNFTPVADEFILGDPALAFLDENNEFEIISLGYIGKKKFVRGSIVSTGAGGGDGILSVGIMIVADAPHHVPFIPVPTP